MTPRGGRDTGRMEPDITVTEKQPRDTRSITTAGPTGMVQDACPDQSAVSWSERKFMQSGKDALNRAMV